MKISYYNSEDDYIQYINSVSYTFQKILNMVFTIFLLFNCLSTVFKIGTTFKFKLFFIALSLIMYLIAFLLFKLISKILFKLISKIFINRNLNKLLRNYTNMIGDKEIKLDEDKLLISTNNETMKYDYSKLSIIVWRKNFIDMAYNKKLLCTIPVNIFDSEEDKDNFIKLAKYRTGKSVPNK